MKKLLVKSKKILAGMLATAIAVTGIQILPATEGLEKVGKDLGVVKEAEAATNWGETVPDSSIQIGDTINWNGKTFKAVKKDENGTLMLSQQSFGTGTWKCILSACSENGGLDSSTSTWFSGLNSAQKEAMKTMPEIKCDQYNKGVYEDFNKNLTGCIKSIKNTRLFPISLREAESIGHNRWAGVAYWTRSFLYNGYYCGSCGHTFSSLPDTCTECGNGGHSGGYGSLDGGFDSSFLVTKFGGLQSTSNYYDGISDVVPAFYLIPFTCTHSNPSSSIFVSATCTSKGTTQYTCDDCGETWTVQDIPALGHDSEKRKCNKDGTDTLKCSRCNAIQDTVPCIHYKTLTYDATTNGGNSNGNCSSDFLINSAIDLTTQTASKNNWTFVGWNTDMDATTPLTSYSMPADNSILYAIFKRSLELLCIDSEGENPQNTTIYNRTTSADMQLPIIRDYTDETGDEWTAVGWTTSTDPVADYSVEGDSITVS